MYKLPSNKKRLRIISLVLCLCVAFGGAAVGAVHYIKAAAKPVSVFAVSEISSSGYEESGQTYGVVSAERLHNIYISATQTVTQVFVTQGQQVKAGDPILSYDTTLSEIALARRQNDVDKLAVGLEQTKKELAQINTLRPYTAPTPTPVPSPTPTPVPQTHYPIPTLLSGTGTEDSPFVYAWNDSQTFTADFIAGLFGSAREVWCVFRATQGDLPDGEELSRWNMHFVKDETNEISFSMFTPLSDENQSPEPSLPDDTAPEQAPADSGYTAAEIAKMRAQKQEEVTKADLSLRMAKVELARARAEMTDGVVVSKTDGVVQTLRDPAEAKKDGTAAVQISDNGGYIVTANFSELSLSTLALGQTVQLSSWENGVSAQGVITEISPYPTGNTMGYGSGNTNSSFYPVKIQVSADAGLKENEYVGVTYTQGTTPAGFYIPAMLVLSQDGKKYVYRENADKVLEKTEIAVGRTLWGDSVQVLGGLRTEDYIAFPYGKAVKNGAKTVHGNTDSLYGEY